MIILGIETSCDDTSIAILKIENRKLKILSNVVSSQVKLHAQYGGVYPFLAKREHQKNLPLVFNKALKKAGFKISNSQSPNYKNKIDLIAVTFGPGLEPCLWQGINFAKELAEKLNLKIVPVNHLEAHIFANWLSSLGKNFNFQSSIFKKNILPAICLIVSGGHTQLVLMKDIGKYKILGETRDDAAGECLDKTARILGLGYPGGPIIAKKAKEVKNKKLKIEIVLPRPMIHHQNYDFSFSGLKTAVLYNFKSHSLKERKSKEYILAMAKEIQQAIIDVLIAKTLRATKEYKVKSIILGGGVSANEELRKQFQLKIKNLKPKINFLAPKKEFCTDNAAMTALTSYFHQKEAKTPKKVEVNANLRL